jgi:hypothetical protein
MTTLPPFDSVAELRSGRGLSVQECNQIADEIEALRYEKAPPFTPEQLAWLRDAADHAAEKISHDFAMWAQHNSPLPAAAKQQMLADVEAFLAAERGWFG